MSLQMPVTEDTPPDMLSGAMDLNVILPNGSVIKMSVERSTPMMDLLVQITTAHKLSPGSHALHAIGDRGILPYKPSTPIGALDTWTVNIVPKNLSKNGRYQPIIKCIPKPFEQTFRLQVRLPRNQLYVARISPKTQLGNIRKQVCFEKNLDPSKYTLRNPDKLNEPLDLSKTLVDYKLQQLSLVLNTNRTLIGGLSSDDIMSRAPKKFSCDDSLSSGSLGGRSLSPSRSDESSDTPRRSLMVKVLPSRPVRKRRLAPKPPPPSQQLIAPEPTIISHSRNSSDSSGYHESSVLSDAVDCSVGTTRPEKFSPSRASRQQSMSRSMTNLQACGKNQNGFSETPFVSIGQSKQHSASTASLLSIKSRKKKAPPPSQVNKPKLAPPQEEPEGEPAAETQRKSQTLPPVVTANAFTADAREKSKTVSRLELNNNNNNVVEPDLSPATSSSLSSLSRSDDVDRDTTEPCASPASSIVVVVRGGGNGCCKYLPAAEPKSRSRRRPAPEPPARSSSCCTFNNRPAAAAAASDQPDGGGASATPRSSSSGSTVDEDELPCMDDEEIDRIFGDATSGYDTPSIVTVKENVVADITIDWEYKLPDPPSAFRDGCGGDRSPAVTMFDTVTVGSNLTKEDIVLQDDEPAAVVGPEDDDKDGRAAVVASGGGGSVKKMIGYHDNCCFTTQDSGIGSADDSSLPSSCEEKLHADDKPAVVHAVSKLNNFKIAAYDEDRTGPTEIFCDDSVKTWKTTQMARESNPAYRSQTPSSIRHHKSFTADRANLSVPVKRSTSHISLLSGNITPSNRLAKHYVGRRTFSSERLLNRGDGSLVRRSFSVDDITEDARENCGQAETTETIAKKIEPALEQSSPLHSLQILKTILPQIEDRDENNDERFLAYSTSKKTADSSRRTDGNPLDAAEEQGDHLLKPPPPPPPPTPNESRPSRPSAESTAKPRKHHPHSRELLLLLSGGDDRSSSANRYAGPPNISLSTWNERPKRQVSIKTDRDYVIGVCSRQQRTTQPRTDRGSLPVEPPPPPEEQGPAGGTADPVSRVPIVRSVELKKPYAGLQRTATAMPEAICRERAAKLGGNNCFGGRPCGADPARSTTRAFGKPSTNRPRKPSRGEISADPRESLLESIRSFGGRDNLRKIRG